MLKGNSTVEIQTNKEVLLSSLLSKKINAIKSTLFQKNQNQCNKLKAFVFIPLYQKNWFETAFLSQYPGLENVEDLDLRKNKLGDEGLDALLSSDKLDNIKKLDLRNNQITRKGMEILAGSGKMKNLKSLDLRSNRLGKAWEDKLRSSVIFPNLSWLKTA